MKPNKFNEGFFFGMMVALAIVTFFLVGLLMVKSIINTNTAPEITAICAGVLLG